MSVDGHLHGVRRIFRGGRALAFALVVLALMVCAAAGLLAAPASAAESVEYSDQEIAFIALLNDYRVANGLQPVLASDALSLAAQRHSSDMGKYKYFDHYTRGSDWFPWGYAPWDRMSASGYDYKTCMGENIAAGQSTAASVFNAFKASSGHNAIMLGADYEVVGVGFVYNPNAPYGYYWTVDFGGYVDPSAHGLGDDGYYQNDDWHLTYLGDWDTANTWWASGGSYATTDDPGAVAIATFTGTEVKVIAKKCPWYGKMRVSVDGGSTQTVDLYSSNWSQDWKQTVYTKSNLGGGAHTITIEYLGQKNSSSCGTSISLDALDIEGSLEQAPTVTRIDDKVTVYSSYAPDWAHWDYSGYWAASSDTYAYTDDAGDKATITFTGTYFSWVAATSNTKGKALVTVDGGASTIVDLYSPSTLWKQNVYATGLLDYGTHTVTIECLGEKNYASWWYTVNLDRLDILTCGF